MASMAPNGDSRGFYGDMLQRALTEIDDALDGHAVMVSAELRVGSGQQIVQRNIDSLRAVIAALRTQGENVFDQVPWLDINQPGAPMDYATKFEVFWRGLLGSGRITKLVVPEESRGTRGVESEITYASQHNVQVVVRKLAELLGGAPASE